MARKCLKKLKERVAIERETLGWKEEKKAFFESRVGKLEKLVEEERGGGIVCEL